MKHETPPDEAIRIEDRWYVLATSARAGDPTRVLKHGESFALFDRYGDMPRASSGDMACTTRARVSFPVTSSG
jgi:hypothetical protein